MRVTIVKYLNKKGFIKEINKESLKGKVLPKNIIEEYEIEIPDVVDLIEDIWLEDLKRKYASGKYILLWNNEFNPPYGWNLSSSEKLIGHPQTKLIYSKHKDILEEYLKNPSVEIEFTNYEVKDADMETTWYPVDNFIEDYNEDFLYRLKKKDLAWYEDESNFPCLMYNPDKKEYNLIIIWNPTQYLYSDNLEGFRPATESEALSLVYKPQQKVSKETTLAESNRLKDLFLKNEAECLVENEQEFRLVYDFLDKTCDKSLDRWTPSKDSKGFYDIFPLLILCSNEWNNIFEYNFFKDRKVYKPLIKYSNGVFILVKQGGEI